MAKIHQREALASENESARETDLPGTAFSAAG
jgi:hypothetical protein